MGTDGENGDREAQAAQWYARLHAPDCSPEERTAFTDWLNADAANQRAFGKIERVLRAMDSLAKSNPRFATLTAQAGADNGPNRSQAGTLGAPLPPVGSATQD